MKLFGSAQSMMRGRSVELDFVRGIAIIAVMGYHFHVNQTGSALISII